MIELRCWGCGREGSVSDRLVGLRVTCKRCGAESTVPDKSTQEVYVADWLAAVDPTTESVTREVDCRPLAI